MKNKLTMKIFSLICLILVSVIGISFIINNRDNGDSKKDRKLYYEYALDPDKDDISFNLDSDNWEPDDIYAAYCYIDNHLKNMNKLTNEDILSLANIYIKLTDAQAYNNIDYDSSNDLPAMPNFYNGNISADLIYLLCTNNLLVGLKNSDGYDPYLAEHYLSYIDNTNLEDVKIVQCGTDYDIISYEIFSNEGKYFFTYVIDPSSVLYQDGGLNYANAVPYAISITEAEKNIPIVDSEVFSYSEQNN